MSQQILIVYASKYGTTEKVATYIGNAFGSRAAVKAVSSVSENDIQAAKTIIIGGAIYGGSLHRMLRNFLKKHMRFLTEKQVFLFQCCMSSANAEANFEHAFPADIRAIATAHYFAGGEYLFDKLNQIEASVITELTGLTESKSEIQYDQIDRLVEAVNLLGSE